MAHTGVKRFSGEAITLAAAAGVRVVSVGSLTAEHPGSEFVLRTVEREKSAAFTASHLAAMTVLAQVATELGERRKAPGAREFRAALGRLPDQVAGVLARRHRRPDLVRGARPAARTAVDGLQPARCARAPLAAPHGGTDPDLRLSPGGTARHRSRPVPARRSDLRRGLRAPQALAGAP